MKIAIAGAGKLGLKAAQSLLDGDNDITIIDKDAATLQKVASQIDVLTVAENAKETRVLRELNIASYDFLIATTDRDEKNIVIASFAKKLGCKKVIARIRDPEHIAQMDFIRKAMDIDYIVNPDKAITTEIYKYLAEKYTLDKGIFSSGKISLIEFEAERYPRLLGTKIGNFGSVCPEMLVVAISRNGKVIIPKNEDVINDGDLLYIMGERKLVADLNHKVKDTKSKNDVHKVMILGGGRTGYYLADALSNFGSTIKVIERDMQRCHYLSTHLSKAMIINGDATDLQILDEENIGSMDAVIATTGFDEDNLLLALTAKQHDVEDVIAKVSRESYAEIITKLGIDMVLNPLNIAASTIMRYVHGDKKVLASQLIQGQAELSEIYASRHMKLLNKPLRDLNLPDGVIVVAITRGEDELIIPTGDTVIQERDKVIILSLLSDMAVTESLLNDNSKLKILNR